MSNNNPTRIKQVFFIDSAVPDSDVIVANFWRRMRFITGLMPIRMVCNRWRIVWRGTLVLLIPKLKLGNSVLEAPASSFAKQELRL